MLRRIINAPLLDLDPAESSPVLAALKQINSASEKEFFGRDAFFVPIFRAEAANLRLCHSLRRSSDRADRQCRQRICQGCG
ncbi:MAG: hypothetical protein KBF85_10640, partial [Tabrizicola sp.]|nr:hypothetical protein [Tabrizicola sp.]